MIKPVLLVKRESSTEPLKMSCLVFIDDYSRFTWVFFLATKDETSGILKSFITRIENLVDHKVKRRNRMLIEAARTMLADSKLPTTFWAEAVNTACYVQNRVLVVKPYNKNPYELFHGRTLTLSFIRPFGCPVTIFNTIDHLGIFNGKADEGSGPDWLFDIDALTRTMNYEPIVTGTQSNGFIDNKLLFDPNMPALEDVSIFNFSNDDKDDDFVVYQMDVKSSFLYRKIEEEVYVCQPLGFEDLDFLDRVYKVEKALYGLHQVPRAWYETLSTYLLDNGFQSRKINKILFIKRNKDDILMIQVYVDDIIFGSAKKDLCNAFERLMHEKFQAGASSDYAIFSLLQAGRRANYNMHSMGKTINELHSRLKLHEQNLPKNNAHALHAIRADGFINRFVNNTIQVYRNNMVYFSAIPRDGIFEIDLFNSYTNESSIYAVSKKRAKLDLDFALLWHCRLGHISKKRIEKLQHDGLLNSNDLRAFEKCVPCMPRKMARKPYTHQVERAKDLLGLIHTDVCGPSEIMSRQRASYFVTFTDDFSPYGYVYLLKHKHEVFENFKVFQKKVENQLKRRNRTLLDMVRSMMSQTTLPKSFWDYVLETATRILNMVPTKKVEKTPYKDLEIIQEEDMYPSIDTSLNHKEDDQEIDEPQSDISPIRRSTRKRHASDRMCLYIDAEEHELGDLGESANYKAALLDLESEKWLNAMNVEIGLHGGTLRFCQSKISKQGASTPAELKRMKNVPYASAVGSIMYDVRCTRPDVAFAQNVTSRFQQNPGDLHWITVKNILKYLRNTKDMFLVYGEAEYIAAFDASKEAVWVRKFISGLGVVLTIEEPI
nr:hypothetical protein [Tanacetum cinerariifolium]